MYTRIRIRRWLTGACFFTISLFCIGLANAAAEGAELDERQLSALKLFVQSDGTKPYFIEGFETEAIRTVIEQLKNEPEVYDQARMLFTLMHSFEQMKGLDPKLVSAGEAAIREKLKSDAPGIRELAMGIVAVREKDVGLDRLVPFLNDPNESVRVTAADLFGNFGSEARIAQLEAVLAERAKGLTAEEIRRDYVFRRGYAAIEKLKQHWRQPAAERVEPPPPPAPSTPPPSTPKPTATPVATRTATPPPSPVPIASVAEAPTPSTQRRVPMWPWLVGIAALIAIVALALKSRS